MERPILRRRGIYLPGLLALMVVVASSAWIIWAINSPFGWPAKVFHVLAASTIALLVAGLIGIETINVFMTLAVLSMATEGLILGNHLYGWPGAVTGVVVGLLLSPFVALIATAAFVTLTWIGSSPGPAVDQASVVEPGRPVGTNSTSPPPPPPPLDA